MNLKIINFLAKNIYLKYNPQIILITGSSGKTLVLETIKRFLKNKKNIFATEYRQDHILAIPLTFILEKEYKLLKNILKALKLLFFKNKDYPEIIILEFRLEKPEIVDYWLNILKIDYLILTSIGKIPPYLEIFGGPEKLKNKYLKIAQKLNQSSVFITNGDDLSCFEIYEKAIGIKILFGINKNNDIIAKDINIICDINSTPSICGTHFSIENKNLIRKIFLRNLFGKHIVYSSLAAYALFINLGFKEEEILNYLEEFSGVKHRSILIKSKNGFYILDNSYHLTLESFYENIETFKKIPAKRKIILIGDILSLGKYAFEIHNEIGKNILNVCDFLIGFGVKSKFTIQSAIEYGYNPEKTKHFFHTELNNLKKFLKEFLKVDDLILITGDKNLNLHLLVDSLV